jgi:hypothetical protein
MPAPRKKKATPKRKVRTIKRVRTVKNPYHTELEVYAIWLNEYFNALKEAGFPEDICLSLIMEKDSYPAWVEFKLPKNVNPSKYLDEEDED